MNHFGKIVGAGLLATGLLSASPLGAAIHRQGCENPLDGVRVCWEATGESDAAVSPFSELHLMAVAYNRAGEMEVLTDYTRKLFQQLLPGNLTQRLHLEWDSALYLDQALELARERNWPTVLWISPREMRNSSAASPGLVDWEVHLIDGLGGQLLRTMRIRVESHPHIRKDDADNALTMAGGMAMTGMAFTNPVLTLGAVATAAALGGEGPPEAGISLDMMSSLAARQVMFLSQYSIEDLAPPPVVAPNSVMDTIAPPVEPTETVLAPGLTPAGGPEPRPRNWLEKLFD
ncbi:MAG: hypothetical protein HQL82_00555 [Magnetococcales bacterium]|nr:hypothetical protein [Magnetococcales bacterium]